MKTIVSHENPSGVLEPLLRNEMGAPAKRLPIVELTDTVLLKSCCRFALPRHDTSHYSEACSGHADSSLVKIFARGHADTTLFLLAVKLIDWGKVPESFRLDREKLLGVHIVPEEWEKRRPAALSALRSHLSLLESQLQLDGRTWLFDTTCPSLADIAAYPVIRELRMLGPQLFEDDAFPGIILAIPHPLAIDTELV